MLCLFDIDGTLIGGDGAGRRSFDRACIEILGDVFSGKNPLDHLKLDGMTDPLILREVFDVHLRRVPTAIESQAVFAAYVRLLEIEMATAAFRVHPGVEESIALLVERRATIGLATGNLEEGARIKLSRGNLWRHFSFGGYGSDLPHGSTERAEVVRVAIKRGVERAGRAFSAHEILVIGDTPKDISAAHAAGARAIAVATGSYSVDQLKNAGADEAYQTLEEWHLHLR